MKDWLADRSERLCEFFHLKKDANLLPFEAAESVVRPETDEHLALFNIEWHVIPSAAAVPLDDDYIERLYPKAPRDFNQSNGHRPSYREAIVTGHRKHQGRILGVENTPKPRYLPGNRQFYGTLYGFDATRDPFDSYISRAGLSNSTRYDHNYLSLREFLQVVNKDWREQSLMPTGYRLTICPPAVFNLIGTIFHHEWSETETLEMGFYRDTHGSATCFEVGSTSPGDFSYISDVEGKTEWALAGFRLALVPE